MEGLSGDDIARIGYLSLLAIAVAGSVVTASSRNIGRAAQQAAIWGLIFLGVVGAYGLWPTLKSTLIPQQRVLDASRIEIPLAADGHYYVTADVNGVPLRFAIDTGATEIVLSQDDARSAGIDPAALGYSGSAMTANGRVSTARVFLDRVTLGPFEDTGVEAQVNGGEMGISLLGMSYLATFARIEIEAGRMVLSR